MPLSPIRPLPITPNLPEKPSVGTSSAGTGALGQSNTGVGIVGQCLGPPGIDLGPGSLPPSDGVQGYGKNGVHGQTISPEDFGVLGENLSDVGGVKGGAGVCGTSRICFGVYGWSSADGAFDPSTLSPYSGVWGRHTGNNGPGVLGSGNGGFGVVASSAENYGLFAEGGKGAAWLRGDLTIDGNIGTVNTITVSGDIIMAGADCAEHFDVADAQPLAPGTVVIIDHGGVLRESRDPYDKRVAGVVSGAGAFRTAIILDGGKPAVGRALVALIGKVYCNVDAADAPIEVGDLLTTAATPGHAMKATDRDRAFGTVLGKALAALEDGQGCIPILVALQ